MTTNGDDPLLQFTDAELARPLPEALLTARADVLAAVRELRTIPDAKLTREWLWKGGSEEEIRYGFYRIPRRSSLPRSRRTTSSAGRARSVAAPPISSRRPRLRGGTSRDC